MLFALFAEFYKFFNDVKRYWFEYLIGYINHALFLIGIYWGISSLSPQRNIGAVFVALLLWGFSGSAITSLSNLIGEERYLGTIERIDLTRVSLLNVFVFRMFVEFLFQLSKMAIIGGILFMTFKPSFTFLKTLRGGIPLIVIISLISIFMLYGFGFFIASVGLMFKRVYSLASILEYVILFLSGVIIPFENLPSVLKNISVFLPLTLSALALNKVANLEFPVREIIFLVIYTGIIVGIGILVFKVAMKWVKKTGEFSAY